MRLRCEIAVPSGLRRSRVLVRLEQPEPDLILVLPAAGLGAATHQIVDAAGVPLVTHLAERDPGVSAELARTGVWDLPEALALLAAARPGTRAVDVGAHVGYYAVLLARAARAGGAVYAFDPAPDHRLALAANAALLPQLCSGAAPVAASPLALGDHAGNARLHLSDRNPGDHTTAPGGPDPIDSRVVPAATLDALRWPAEGPPELGGPVDLLKVDVPGGEGAVLRGAERVLAEDRPVVAATVRGGAGPAAALVEWLAARGYEAFRLLPPTAPDPYPLLADVARVLAPAEAADHLRRRPGGPPVTVLAYPAPPAAP